METNSLALLVMQAAIKTISEEDKYFSRVSLRLECLFDSSYSLIRVKVQQGSFCWKYVVNYLSAYTRMPSFGLSVKSSQGELSKDGNSGATSEVALDGWDGIALEYTVDWPLQLFFTQEVLSK